MNIGSLNLFLTFDFLLVASLENNYYYFANKKGISQGYLFAEIFCRTFCLLSAKMRKFLPAKISSTKV